ncbi:phage neck terminator protein [Cupriavidus pampae]|uniref:Phage neck terminator protein gp12-like domain-containing protein n=1 Tax=Cupriavidus pampae TaxID=659251 RepID=A0ABN7YX43_9BURK|nr:hypothetical protein [Cupriavidus pampae]CAG9177848.1 hypothetical protein LMG32289_03925 [Cupriavidus pampae]
MANTSATGGPLAPAVASPPIEDDALDDLLRVLVAGVTGLSGSMVRSLWQPADAEPPGPDTDWCAMGITAQTNDAAPVIRHDPAGDGSDIYIRHQDLDVLCSFYGPGAKGNAQRLADGMAIPQNSEQLGVHDAKFISVSDIRPAQDFVNQQGVRRYDMTLNLRRKITRTYPVLNLLSAEVQYTTDSVPPVAGTTIIDQ